MFAELDAKAPSHVPLASSSSRFPSSKSISDCKHNPPYLIPSVKSSRTPAPIPRSLSKPWIFAEPSASSPSSLKLRRRVSCSTNCR
ncbi:uncharacterized protein BCR38DRAFT_431720 [Pseudomassariella vexata]|uniref:Uncharacterized protein n=1 Tax=Pseudomassariella vexata TaxID=1141098 RepID=A0A1Y2E0P5_9PEZI|nr:uncharacterized protein BCR38DRAFT_431720 [Pseudomassariella vexata]ORY65049.1 hypothetical protein BCR38DRAFT_431720 [Pseudomassariella vexata]